MRTPTKHTKLKHIQVEPPKIEHKKITDFPLEDQQRWANIQPYKPPRSIELDTLATQSKRRMRGA